MEWVLLWLGLSVLAGVVGSSKGRSGVGFFLLALALSPLIGLLAAGLMPPKLGTGAAGGDSRARVPCPRCAEMVLPQAQACPHCGYGVLAHLRQAELAAFQAQQAEQAAERAELAARSARRAEQVRDLFGSRSKPPSDRG
jgi:ribosomal protein L37E